MNEWIDEFIANRLYAEITTHSQGRKCFTLNRFTLKFQACWLIRWFDGWFVCLLACFVCCMSLFFHINTLFSIPKIIYCVFCCLTFSVRVQLTLKAFFFASINYIDRCCFFLSLLSKRNRNNSVNVYIIQIKMVMSIEWECCHFSEMTS